MSEHEASTTPASQDSIVLPEISGRSFAITHEGLEALIAQAGDAPRAKALLGKPGERMRGTESVQIRNGVAVLNVIGPIFHYQNILTWILGWPSAEVLALDLQKALDNPAVSSMVLNIDSPGGQVGGINELAGMIRQAREVKPIQAYVGDLGASAAYWLASAASRITVDATAQLGSIGVVFGLRRRKDDTLEIVNSDSPLKRPDIDTEEGIRVIKERADSLAEVFIQAVMENRNMSRDRVTALKGGLLVGQAAVEARLADQVGGMEQLIKDISYKPYGGTTMADMTLEDLKANHAGLYLQVKEEGKAEGKQEAEQTAKGKETEAVQKAQTDTVAMAKAVLGDEAGKKLEQAVASGMTAEQIAQAKTLFGSSESSDERTTPNPKQNILNGLQQVHGHQGLTPGGNTQQTAGNPLTADAESRAGKKQ